MAFTNVDLYTTPEYPRIPFLVRALACAGLVGLSLGLWGVVTSDAWTSDSEAMAGADRGSGDTER